MAKNIFSTLFTKAAGHASKKANAATPRAVPLPLLFVNMYTILNAVFNMARPAADFFDKLTNNGQNLPEPLAQCFARVEHSDAIKKEGIYRVSGAAAQYKKLVCQWQKGRRADLSQASIGTVTSAAKLYIRELRETVLTAQQQQQLDQVEDPAVLRATVLGLSAGRRAFLQGVCAHLSAVAEHQSSNKMDARNLAVVFSPTLGVPLKPMEVLINQYSSIFAADATTSSDDTEHLVGMQRMLWAEEDEVEEGLMAAVESWLGDVLSEERSARLERVMATSVAGEDRMLLLETMLPGAANMDIERMEIVEAVLARCVAQGCMDADCADDLRRYSLHVHMAVDYLWAVRNKVL